MVADLVRLRLLVLKNSLSRSTAQLVFVILGGLYGLLILGIAVAGLFALSAASVDLARTIVILAGSVLVLGWIIIPVIMSGTDQTLDIAKLVTFPIPLRTLLAGLTLAGVVGVPGIVTTVAALATAGTWWTKPGIAVIALVCGALAALTCVIASRAVSSLSSTFASGRRYREVIGLVAFVPLVLLGPIIISITSGIRASSDALPGLASALGWTPLGALWAVPSEVALGHGGEAALKFLIGLAFLAVLLGLWRHSVSIALVTPKHTVSRIRAQGKLGFFALFPGTPAGAVAARSLTYWTRDPRYARQLLIVPLIPVLLFFYSRGATLEILNALGPVTALLLSLSIFADLSYDGTAFTTQVASGIRGMDDRAGRVVALGTFALPLVIAFTIASVWISDSWQLLPALLGLSLGVLLSGLGLSSVSSARIVIPVPAPGDNPFKSPPGSGFTTTLTTFATWGILWVLVIPELVLFLIALFMGSAPFGWITLTVGVVLGSVFLVLGVRIGGAGLDRRSPDLLEQLRRER